MDVCGDVSPKIIDIFEFLAKCLEESLWEKEIAKLN